jgi:acyl-CoA thioesterase-2
VKQTALDLSRVFDLEPHGPDTFLGESPRYPWGRIYGGLVIAQALWAATRTVRPEHRVHSLHAYFILGCELGEPVRYEVDRVRNGRSFTTRRVVARQSTGAILTLGCSFQVAEAGAELQSAVLPEGIPSPDKLEGEYDAGVERRDAPGSQAPPRSFAWVRYPLSLGEDLRLQSCALAYVSDLNPMNAALSAHPGWTPMDGEWDEHFIGASLDHAMWFHRPVAADQWLLLDVTAQALVGNRGLATGPVLTADGTHVATVAQEVMLRERRVP